MVLPRICMLSGMKGQEQTGLAEYWQEFAGSKKPMFCAVIPETMDKPVLAILKVRTSLFIGSGSLH